MKPWGKHITHAYRSSIASVVRPHLWNGNGLECLASYDLDGAIIPLPAAAVSARSVSSESVPDDKDLMSVTAGTASRGLSEGQPESPGSFDSASTKPIPEETNQAHNHDQPTDQNNSNSKS